MKHHSQQGDSCIFQLFSTVPEINLSFGYAPIVDVRGVFFDISQGFDKVL